MKTDNASDGLAPASGSALDLRRYAWIDQNRARIFPTWESEIAYMSDLGFDLVPPDYHIPHWSKAETAPMLYVSGRDGPREMSTCFDRCASEMGYPLYAKRNKGAEP